MNNSTDFPCQHSRTIEGDHDVRCVDCHTVLDTRAAFVSRNPPHRSDFMLMDLPKGFRAGAMGERILPGMGWERLENDGGGEAWMQLGETCERYHLTEGSMKHRIKDTLIIAPPASAEPFSLVYLAVPYSHPDPSVKQSRFHAANRVAARLMRQGLHVFSPISSSHPIALDGELPGEWEFWEQYDTAFLKVCRLLIVLTIPGWKESVGVTAEIAIANRLGIPIQYIEE